MIPPVERDTRPLLKNRRGRCLPHRLSARVVADLVIVAYGTALGLLGPLVRSATGLEGAGAPRFDPMIGCFVAAVFVLLCLLIANVDLRRLRTFGAALRKMIACFAAALSIFVLLAWSTTRASWSEAADAALLWFVLGSGLLAALHALAVRRLRNAPAIGRLR